MSNGQSTVNTQDYRKQFMAFCGVAPVFIGTLSQDWVSERNARADFRAVGQIDFAATFVALAERVCIPA